MSREADAARCRSLREDGLTVTEIAETTGIPRSTVGDYVRGINPDAFTERVIDRRLAFAEAYVNRPYLTVSACARLAGYKAVDVSTHYRILRELGIPLRRPKKQAA